MGAVVNVDTLDPTQRAAATQTGSIQLVLAGPGSGKTTTLTSRFVHLVRQGTDRKRILALTFTRKAADDMKARIVQALDLEFAKDLTVATFHGFSFRHLKRNPRLAGLSEEFQLWDTPQQRHVFNSQRLWWNEETDILDIIAGAKERLLDAKGFAAQIDANDEVLRNAVEFFRVYEQALRDAGAIDFADMVPLVVAAMDKHPDYAATMTGAYDHLLVDEYQDVNPGQVELIDRFVRAGVNLWVVGDDDQTLYAFRAADVRFILDFPRKHQGAQVHVLDRNYRSAAQIVAAAKRLIANNRARRDKNYQPVVEATGEIVIRGYRTPEIEARQVARAVAKVLEHGRAPQQIAVLYRTGTIGLALQPALQSLRIPYEVRGAGDLWQGVAAKLVVGALYYLRDGESVEAMSRMGNSRRAEITRGKLDQAGDGKRLSFAASCELVRKIVATAVPGQASDRDRAEWTSVVEAVTALASACRSLQELEAKIAEQSAALRKAPGDAVVLSTIHSAKGLEWDVVFMVGVEEGVLPHANNDDVEEERRVAYVGVTRAKRLLGLTYANVRFGQDSRPSQFLHELAGKERRLCVWTGPRSEGTDDHLPLLSDRERQRLNDGLLPEPERFAPSREPVRRGKRGKRKVAGAGSGIEGTNASRASKRAAKERDRLIKNKNGGAPARHGVAWSVEEDDRLRAMFLRGEAIAAMASAHQRKSGAITSRLIKLGLISEHAIP
jgi:DNA helicase-2/ATP-dependent DNA helicase PcrA